MIMVRGDTIRSRDLTFLDGAQLPAPDVYAPDGEIVTLHRAREQFERDTFLHALASQHGNMSRTAQALGVERSNLYRKMRAFGIAPARKGDGGEEA